LEEAALTDPPVLETLKQLDRSLFLALNGPDTSWADPLMRTVSLPAVWVPLYLLFLYLLRARWGTRGLWWSLPVITAMVWCTDSGSVLLFKDTVQRLRPCHVPQMAGLVHVPDGCGGSFGFVSSHASNHFGIALFMIGALSGAPRWGAWALIGWAGLIGYSRIHLGVHYPGDVIAGALYGAAIGALFFRIFRWIMDRSSST
jgi:undecaprenyl-diphosphatase